MSASQKTDEAASVVRIEGLVTDRVVVVHPTVLLSVVDHYGRVNKGSEKRVAGTLLGEYSQGKVLVTNSFAVPFEEDSKDKTVWFIDQNYHEQMHHMFHKINARQKVVGWYSTGPKIRPADLEIHEMYRRYTPHPVYVIVDPQPKTVGLPTNAYLSFEEPQCDKTFRRTFVHIPSVIGAYEAEEVGVEHLLRDLRNASTSTLATQVVAKLAALRNLVSTLEEMSGYLEQVISGNLPGNPKILYNIQNILNLLPDLNQSDLKQSISLQTNDSIIGAYLGAIVRSVMALANVINQRSAALSSHQQTA